MTEQSGRSRVVMIALGAGIALVVIIALIAVFARSGPVEYAADTPEGVVQRYAQAVIDGDVDTALGYLPEDVADRCRTIPTQSVSLRLTLLDTTEGDDFARVDVQVAASYGSGMLGSSEFDYEAEFTLDKADGEWLITRAPWEFAVCEEVAF
ncbi:hypothetical protein P0L94_01200 [Microbacter sp. GSS18]|nr:hypothetical protein P0L94_01200 [Microbacter sp. GSS18]